MWDKRINNNQSHVLCEADSSVKYKGFLNSSTTETWEFPKHPKRREGLWLVSTWFMPQWKVLHPSDTHTHCSRKLFSISDENILRVSQNLLKSDTGHPIWESNLIQLVPWPPTTCINSLCEVTGNSDAVNHFTILSHFSWDRSLHVSVRKSPISFRTT